MAPLPNFSSWPGLVRTRNAIKSIRVIAKLGNKSAYEFLEGRSGDSLSVGDLGDAAGDRIEFHQGFDAPAFSLEGGEFATGEL